MTQKIPSDILTQHIAVLGKTGSGKTSTAKLAIEQVVADGARVCVLDPIKSDWWGLTSSADGRRAGLPFHILGGPHGHVPLHASAGKVIAEIVANGALPLSIIDMADFEPGGQAKFFVDFAPTLLRKMRGVVYLVIEEAHLFAPKERSGIGAENLSIHWAKTMATAGRSKGVRLMLVTQRTQALHNALLGSCDTLIAHRLTAPADQEPVVKWLKANAAKDVIDTVASSLASLKTGEGWICSGEAKRFERVHFARIATYDNTATPTGDGETRVVKTAPVDQDKLRSIIGDAVDQAKADDPRELRKQITDLKAQLAASSRPPAAEQRIRPALTDADRAILVKWATALDESRRKADESVTAAESRADRLVQTAVAEYLNTTRSISVELAGQLGMMFDRMGIRQVLEKLATLNSQPITPAATTTRTPRSPLPRRVAPASTGNVERRPARQVSADDAGVTLKKAEREILKTLAQCGDEGCAIGKIALLTGYRVSGGFKNALSALRAAGFMEGDNTGVMTITSAGLGVIGGAPAPMSASERRAYWATHRSFKAAERAILAELLEHPGGLTIDQIAAATNYQISGGFKNALSALRTAGVIEGRNTEIMRVSAELLG